MRLKDFDRKTIDKVFDDFLEEAGIYDRYYKYRANTGLFNHELDSYTVDEYINQAFDWHEESDEGHKFWEKIHNSWICKLDKAYKPQTKIIDLI